VRENEIVEGSRIRMTTGLIKGTEKEYTWRQKRRYWHERDNRKGKGDDKNKLVSQTD
jgi:hypothetical protein